MSSAGTPTPVPIPTPLPVPVPVPETVPYTEPVPLIHYYTVPAGPLIPSTVTAVQNVA